MKTKLYVIQEVLREREPSWCIGRRWIFLSKDKCNQLFEKLSAEKTAYQTVYTIDCETED